MTIKFGQYKKIFVDNEFYNEGTDKEYFDLHFQIHDSSIDSIGKILQEACDQKGYPVYVNADTGREINTIIVEIHNKSYTNNEQINTALAFIDDFVSSIK